MSKNSILNYFSRTVKSPSSNSSSPNAPSTSTPTTPKNNNSPKEGTPGRSATSNGRKAKRPTPGEVMTPPNGNGKCGTPRTPTSAKSTANKRKGKSPQSPTEAATTPNTNGRAIKRVRTEDVSPGTKDYTEGVLVWGKMEGYPWWPGFVRDEIRGEGCSKSNSSEFHVQFFDKPPSRAWLRKSDLKLFQGSTDGAVIPARSDPCWVEACKIADSAKALSPNKRLDKYWHNFDSDDDAEEVMEIDPPVRKNKIKTESATTNNNAKRRRRILVMSESESEEEDGPKVEKKKKSDKDNDDEYKPDTSTETLGTVESESEAEAVSEVDSCSELSDQSDGVVDETPRGKQQNGKKSFETPKSAGSSSTPKRQLNKKSKLLDSSKSPKSAPSSSNQEGAWPHLRLGWLQPNNIKDKKLRKMDHPDYDSRKLYVPPNFLESLTPAIRQWWEMKSENYDSVIFFKVGKFYEMYHMDAVIAVEELGLTFMRGEYAHCGFPEIAYSRFAETLVDKGYKVARVEQTETPDMMTERCKKQMKPTKFDRVVRREICQYTTQGVKVASIQDYLPANSNSRYLFAIIEKQVEKHEFGVCFIDTTLGVFNIGQFMDDRHSSRLRTLLSHYPAAEILYEKKSKGTSLSATSTQLLDNINGVRKISLNEADFWDGKKTLTFLAEGSYFRKPPEDNTEWPQSLKAFQSEDDSLGLTPKAGLELGVKCLGAVISYLKQCLVEHDLLSLGQFERYVPLDSTVIDGDENDELKQDKSVAGCPKYMVLDAVTLKNLGITHGPKSILALLDRCATQFGKRLLRQWTCAPLARPDLISDRLDAIDELMTLQDLREKILPKMKTLLDLERLLNKVHSLGSEHRSKDHPDSRAIMFEEKKYSKRKILDLTSILRNFKTCVGIFELLQEMANSINSRLLKHLISSFPALDNILEFFDNAFDHKTALEQGKITPAPGVDPEYDSVTDDIAELNKEINLYLKEMQSRYHRQAKYFGSEKKRFQIEFPDTVRVGHEFEMSSNRKGFKRYYTKQTKAFLSKMMSLETTCQNVLKDITRRIFAQFDKHRMTWKKSLDCVGTLDVLISLTSFSESQENMCRPNVTFSAKPFIDIENGRHPALSQDTYIPNDSKFGDNGTLESGQFLLLTGPNMGGKSTLMRQIGVITVLSHLGCYVPATRCELSVVDRIFTRLGANDNILEGESTFFVELSETSAVLQHSTSKSLVLMDELGRGTATYDGTAIAYAVARALAKLNCRSIFSTHYHTLVESLENLPSIQLGHMACMVENPSIDDPTEETITFLYKLARGACPKSYGFNAAKLAGVPDDVIRLASRKAKDLERNVKRMDLFRRICGSVGKKSFSLQDAKLMKVS